MKKVLALILSFVLVAALSIGGTIAYFTWEAEANNVAIVGNIKVDRLFHNAIPHRTGVGTAVAGINKYFCGHIFTSII